MTRRRGGRGLFLAALLLSGPAFAQHRAMHDMPGMAPSGMAPTRPASADRSAGSAPAPPPTIDRWADRYYPPAEIARAHAEMMREHGGRTFHRLFFNLAELQVRDGRAGYRWDGEGWLGGDLHRLVVKSEGEGASGGRLESGEVQALYSRAVGPYFDLQTGLRHDVRPGAARTYATLDVEGLAPGMFEIEAAAFLSHRGDLLGRLEATYDQRITQRVILQPRVELNLAAQTVRATDIGRGVVDVEFGLRLRYELARELAPYVGVSYEAKTGRTADLARARGNDPTATSLVAGVRFWF